LAASRVARAAASDSIRPPGRIIRASFFRRLFSPPSACRFSAALGLAHFRRFPRRPFFSCLRKIFWLIGLVPLCIMVTKIILSVMNG